MTTSPSLAQYLPMFGSFPDNIGQLMVDIAFAAGVQSALIRQKNGATREELRAEYDELERNFKDEIARLKKGLRWDPGDDAFAC